LIDADSNELELEIDLLRRTGMGDRKSFEQLYDRYCGVLFSTAYRILNQQEAAEDLLQDVFVQIWEKAPMYDPKRGRPLTWVITLTRNRSIDRLRSTQRRQKLSEEVGREAEIADYQSDKSSADEISLGERNRIVRSAVMQLSPDQRRAIELAFFSGLTQTEIAEKLKEPLGTVKARIRRGMMKLRDLLKAEL
jgi:RNA polymerase sigma-70 factor (ECF subfamily)